MAIAASSSKMATRAVAVRRATPLALRRSVRPLAVRAQAQKPESAAGFEVRTRGADRAGGDGLCRTRGGAFASACPI